MSDAESLQRLHDRCPGRSASTARASSPSGDVAEDRLHEAAQAPATDQPRARAESNRSRAGFARHGSSTSADFSWYRTESASSVASAKLGNRGSFYNEAAAGITLEVSETSANTWLWLVIVLF